MDNPIVHSDLTVSQDELAAAAQILLQEKDTVFDSAKLQPLPELTIDVPQESSDYAQDEGEGEGEGACTPTDTLSPHKMDLAKQKKGKGQGKKLVRSDRYSRKNVMIRRRSTTIIHSPYPSPRTSPASSPSPSPTPPAMDN